MATFLFSRDATPEELADVLRLLSQGQQAAVDATFAERVHTAWLEELEAEEDATQHEDTIGCALCDRVLLPGEHNSVRGHVICNECAKNVGTQEENGGHVVTLRHVPEVKDALTDCPACGTQIGVLLWADGSPFVQACPACGAVLRARQNTEGDVIAVTQEAK